MHWEGEEKEKLFGFYCFDLNKKGIPLYELEVLWYFRRFYDVLPKQH